MPLPPPNPNGAAPQIPAEPPVLIIQLNPDGNIGVRGPLTDKAMCYAMLELARDAIRDYNDPEKQEKMKQAKKPGILLANVLPPNP